MGPLPLLQAPTAHTSTGPWLSVGALSLLKEKSAFTLPAAYLCAELGSGTQWHNLFIYFLMTHAANSSASNLTLRNNRELVLGAPVKTGLTLDGICQCTVVISILYLTLFYGSAGKPKLPCLPVNSHCGSANIYINNLIPHTWLVS